MSFVVSSAPKKIKKYHSPMSRQSAKTCREQMCTILSRENNFWN